ncbi:MAG: polysaccharide biosynthesis/export family protein [Bacteroidota bacterium]
MFKSVLYLIVLLLTTLLMSACADTKRVTYFNELTDKEINYQVQNLEPIIQKNDLLNITVTSLNNEANQPFNLYNISTPPGTVNAGTVTQAAGFLVDQDGNIQFPMLGTIKASGLTKKQLKEHLVKSLVSNKLLYDPVINIRYLNYRVTVLGQVAKPSVFNVPGEKITLLEALGLAGDLTIYGERNNVLVIRELQEGKRISKHIDLNSNELLTSPYYYLQPNDVVYVAPNRANVASASTTKLWLPALFGGLSFLTVILDMIIN